MNADDTSPTADDPETTRRAVLGAVGAAATAAIAGCNALGDVQRETETVEFAVPASDVDSVAVEADDGQTVVHGHDSDDVQVEATKYAIGSMELEDVTVSRDITGGRLDIEAGIDGVMVGAGGGGIEELDVAVPQDVTVESVGIDDGEGEIRDVSGDLSLTVDDATAEVGPVDGRLDVSVDDGTVTTGDVARVTGDLDDGRLEMTEAATLGDITVDDGNLDLAVAAVDGSVDVDTDDGDVTAAIASTVDTTVAIEADDGSTEVDDGLLDSISTAGGTTRGEIGDGTSELTISADDGDVRLRER